MGRNGFYTFGLRSNLFLFSNKSKIVVVDLEARVKLITSVDDDPFVHIIYPSPLPHSP